MKRFLLISLFIITSGSAFTQQLLTFNTDFNPKVDSTLVFIPVDYNQQSSYPLVFLLHGWDGTSAQWNEIMGGLQSIADRYHFILCCPDGTKDCWYLDSPTIPNSQFEKFFFSVLVPELQKKYTIDSKNIFITGLSMGGHGALSLFLKHPGFFNSAASTSGILDITEFPENWGMSRYLGSFQTNEAAWKNNSVFYLLDSLKDKDKEFLFDCGTEDFAYNVNLKTYQKCRDLKLKAAFISQPGTHSRDYWKKALPLQLEFFRVHLKNN